MGIYIHAHMHKMLWQHPYQNIGEYGPKVESNMWKRNTNDRHVAFSSLKILNIFILYFANIKKIENSTMNIHVQTCRFNNSHICPMHTHRHFAKLLKKYIKRYYNILLLNSIQI